MRVLVACEFSGMVRDALTRRGHHAVSCDLLPTEREGLHIQGNVLDYLDGWWDALFAFPPCTYLARSGLHWNSRIPGRAEKSEQALEFVQQLMNCPIPRKLIENPYGLIGSRIRKPDQVIQPWQFGHSESKATCLWLEGIAPLVPSDVLEKPAGGWDNVDAKGQHFMGDTRTRQHDRSRTYYGVAEAMAEALDYRR